MNDNEKTAARPAISNGKTVIVSYALAVASIIAAIAGPVVIWIVSATARSSAISNGSPLSGEATLYIIHAVGWLCALAGYALSFDRERVLPIVGVSINLVFNVGMLFLVLYGAALDRRPFTVNWWYIIALPFIIDFLLPVFSFIVILIIKAHHRGKSK